MTENTQLLHKGNTAVWLVSRLTGFFQTRKCYFEYLQVKLLNPRQSNWRPAVQ